MKASGMMPRELIIQCSMKQKSEMKKLKSKFVGQRTKSALVRVAEAEKQTCRLANEI